MGTNDGIGLDGMKPEWRTPDSVYRGRVMHSSLVQLAMVDLSPGQSIQLNHKFDKLSKIVTLRSSSESRNALTLCEIRAGFAREMGGIPSEEVGLRFVLPDLITKVPPELEGQIPESDLIWSGGVEIRALQTGEEVSFTFRNDSGKLIITELALLVKQVP